MINPLIPTNTFLLICYVFSESRESRFQDIFRNQEERNLNYDVSKGTINSMVSVISGAYHNNHAILVIIKTPPTRSKTLK
jgi:hypothetical protein